MQRSFSLAAVLALSPLAWARAQGDNPIVTVNGQAVPQSAVVQRLWKLYGPATLDVMIQEELLRQESQKLKVVADKDEVDRRIKKIKEQFTDEATFQANLTKSGSSAEELKAQIEQQVLRERIVMKAKGIDVTPKDAKDYFDQNKEKLASPESVRIRHLLLTSEQQARDLHVALKAGADFGKLAGQLSQDAASKDRGGDLGFISKGILIPEIEQVAFSLKPGDISDVLKTTLGFHILKVEEKRAPEPAKYDKIKDDLRRALLATKINQAWPEYLKELTSSAKVETPQAPGAGPAPSGARP